MRSGHDGEGAQRARGLESRATRFTSKVITLSQISMSVLSPFYGRASDLADLDMAKVSYRSSIKHYAEGS
jgi:energy-coupling factor transporter transmembrane protein EcfT